MKKWFFKFLEKWDRSRYVFRRIFRNADWPLFLVIALVSAVIASHYFFQVDYPFNDQKHTLVRKAFQQTTQESPSLHLLAPSIILGLTQIADWLLPYRRAFLLSCAFSGWLALMFFLNMLFKYLRIGLSETRSLLGVFFAALLVPLVLSQNFFYIQPIFEVGLFTAALYSIYQKRFVWLAVILIIAVLNGQWVYFVPFIFLLTYQGKWDKGVLGFIALMGVLTLVNFIFYLMTGGVPYRIIPIPENGLVTSFSKRQMINSILFISSLSVFAIWGLGEVQPFFKRTALIIPLYFLVMLFGRFPFRAEIFLILLPMLLPMSLQVIPRSTRPAHHH